MRVLPIKISYDQNILDSKELVAEDGKLTVIIGESGSGKSSLLSYIYLELKDRPSKIISFDKEYNIQNKRVIKQNLITYIRQDKDFIEDISCYENIRLLCTTNDKTLSKEDSVNLFKKVGLDVDYTLYPNQLSGGERCKLAFAIALARQSEIILFDEITASLDEKSINEIIVLIKKLCEDDHKTIICTTHSKQLEEYADTLYIIEDKKLKLVRESNTKKLSKKTETTNHFVSKKKWSVCLQRINKDYITNIIYTLCMGILVSLLCVGFQYAFQYRTATATIKQYSNPNDYYLSNVNMGDKSVAITYDYRYSPFTKEQTENISSVLEGLTYQPFYNFYLFVNDYKKNQDNLYSFDLFVNGEEIKENNKYNQKIGTQPIYIFPYFPQQEYDNLCSTLDSSVEGVYISRDIANVYGINEVNNTKIKITVEVPSYYTKEMVSSSNGTTYESRMDHNVYVEIEMPIRGILSSHRNELLGKSNIYMNYEDMDKILKENMLSEDQLPEGGFVFDYSSYIVFTEDNTDITQLTNKLDEADSNLIFRNLNHYYDTAGVTNIQNEEIVAKFVFLAFFSFIILLFVYGKIHEKKESKFYDILDFYGFRKKDKVQYILMNILFFTIIIFILAETITMISAYWLVKQRVLLTIFKYSNLTINVIGLTILANVIMSIPILYKVIRKHD